MEVARHGNIRNSFDINSCVVFRFGENLPEFSRVKTWMERKGWRIPEMFEATVKGKSLKKTFLFSILFKILRNLIYLCIIFLSSLLLDT